jgi:hypothetical protein
MMIVMSWKRIENLFIKGDLKKEKLKERKEKERERA